MRPRTPALTGLGRPRCNLLLNEPTLRPSPQSCTGLRMLGFWYQDCSLRMRYMFPNMYTGSTRLDTNKKCFEFQRIRKRAIRNTGMRSASLTWESLLKRFKATWLVIDTFYRTYLIILSKNDLLIWMLCRHRFLFWNYSAENVQESIKMYQ